MSDRPTICQVLHSLNVGGAEILAAQLARRLSDRYRFVFGCLDHLGTLGETLRDEAFRVEVLARRPGVDVGCLRRMAQFWRKEKVALVHTHQYTPFFYAMAARGFRRGPPVLFNEHGRHQPDFPRRKRILFNRIMLRRTDRVVAVGRAVRQALIDNEGIPPDRVDVIYNGIDIDTFAHASQTDREAVRREIGLSSDDFVLMLVGRLDYLKDHATAIRSIERLAERLPNIRLLFIGEGPEREKIEAEITRRSMDRYVRLLGLRQDIARLLSSADLFLLTSISEGIPVTLIEAMAAGLAIISTDVGGVSEVVEPEKTGLLVPKSDDAALADAILRLIEQTELRRQMGTLGKQRAEQIFSESMMHEAYARCFEAMLGR